MKSKKSRYPQVDENSYEFQERLAILQVENPDMHTCHALNKARKEIAARVEVYKTHPKRQREVK